VSGAQLRDALAAASQHLRDVAKAIDAINVYPVPDGDTGSNMSATMREAVDVTLLAGNEPTVHEALEALAHGALYGARGNSGVILSQALRGFCLGVGDPPLFDAAALAAGLDEAAREAYAAVNEPQEGTMLTVLRLAAIAASAGAAKMPVEGRNHPCLGLLGEVIEAAEQAESATIDQLAELREAGVPDAGGEGVCVILRGLYAAIAGTIPPPPAIPERPIAMISGHETEQFGYCTEFLVQQDTQPLDIEGIRAAVSSGGARSVVIVGDERLMRVHVHTDMPDEVLERVAVVGKITRPKIEDMSAQNTRWNATGSGAGVRLALLALSRGEGFDAIFRSLGAHVTDLGEVVNPPAGDIAAAADALSVPDVIVLSNHKNVILAARQAAKLTRCTLHVVPTESLPQGVAAALALDPDESATANVAAMERATATVRTVEVTRAAASRRANGVSVRKGDAIALADGKLIEAASSYVDALIAGLNAAGAAHAGLVTVYGGAEVDQEATDHIRNAVAAAFPGVEVEAVHAGQPLYALIASVEE